MVLFNRVSKALIFLIDFTKARLVSPFHPDYFLNLQSFSESFYNHCAQGYSFSSKIQRASERQYRPGVQELQAVKLSG
jgi:hypothetical protein